MSTARLCPHCHAELPPDSPGGLCPKCLMQMALGAASQASIERTSSFSGATVRFVPPPVENIARLFPQLEILGLLGVGGMGAVYKARQPGLDRLVALKILPPGIGDAAFADRFAREARALAKLNHPHIVSVFDSGVVEGLYYFVMEYVDGVNLRQALRDGQIDPTQALGIVGQVCDALQFAHDEGIVHRDIKPENILLDKRGRVKIADFGLAKLLGDDALDHSLTGTHQVMGTPKYMAPEQLEGTKSVDHRADIYSLGVVFYELLTGELPLGRFAAPSKKAPIDVRLDDVVLRALEKEPAERYQHASEVKTEVEVITSAPRVISRPAPRPQPRRPGREVHELNGAPPSSAVITLWAIVNIIGAVLFMLLAISDDPAIKANEEIPWYRTYAFLDTAGCYITSAMLFAGGIGLLMRKSWGRWLVVAVCVYTLVAFVVQMPIVMRYTLPPLADEMALEFKDLGKETAEALAWFMVMMFLGVGIVVALTFSVGQLVYFTRRRVIAAFEPLSPAWDAVRVPIIVWSGVFVLVCGGLIAAYLSPWGPKVTSNVAIAMRPISGAYQELQIVLPMVERPALRGPQESPTPRAEKGAADTRGKISSANEWACDFIFVPKENSQRRTQTSAYRLRVRFPRKEATWGEHTDARSNVLVLDRIDADDLNLVLQRDLAVPKNDQSIQAEHQKLLRFIDALASGKPRNETELEALVTETLDWNFVAERARTDSREVTGFTLDLLIYALLIVTLLFVAGLAALGSAGRSIIEAGEKPIQRATREVQVIGTATMISGLIMLLGMFVVMPLIVMYQDQHKLRWLEPVIGIVGGWSFLSGLALIACAVAIRRMSRAALWIASVIGAIPLAPQAIFILPIGVWGLWLLGREDVQQAQVEQRERAADPRSTRHASPWRSRDESLPYQLGSLLRIFFGSRQTPTNGAVVLGILGACCALLPWAKVTFVGGNIVRTELYHGYDHLTGLLATGLFLFIAVSMFATGSLAGKQLGRGLAMSLCAAVAVAFVCMSVSESKSLIDTDIPTSPSVQERSLKSEPLFGTFAAVSCGVALLLVSAWEVRRSLSENA